MASETAATNHSSEEVEKELKPEVKIMEPVQVCPAKESVYSPEPEEVPGPVSTYAGSGEEAKTKPIVNENIKGTDTDESPKAEESVVWVDESEKKSENKQVEVPPCEEEKKTEDASNNNGAELEKVLHPEPAVNNEGEPVEKLDAETVEKQEESKDEPSVEKKLGEPEKTVEVSEQLPAKRAAREYIGNVEVLPDEELGESEAELAKVDNLEEDKDGFEKMINGGGRSSLEDETEVQLDTGTFGKQEESKVKPSVEEKLGEPEKVAKELPAREYIGNVEVSPDEEFGESEAELAKVDKPEEQKDELEKRINDGGQSSLEGETEEKLEIGTVEKQEESKVEPSVEEKLGEPEKVAEASKELPATIAAREYIGNVEVLPDEELGESEAELAKVDKPEEEKDEVEKIINAGGQSSLEGETEEKLENGTLENQELSKVEPSVEEKLGEPEEVAEASKELPASREYVGNAEVRPDKQVEGSEAELSKVGKAEERKDEQKIINAGEQSSIEAVEEKVANVDENPGEQVEAIKEKEVEDAETKPEETDATEKLEQSTVKSVQEKPEEPSETVQLPIQSSVDPVLEELPKKEAPVIVEKQGTVSEAEPAEKQDDFKLEQDDEKVEELAKTADHCSSEPIEEIVEKTLPAKEFDGHAVKEADVSETQIKPEEIPERASVGSIENISVDPAKIVDDPKQSLVREKVEELPEKDVEADVNEKVLVPESEPKHEEISNAEPSGKLKFELPGEKPDEPKEESEAVGEEDKSIEKVGEVPANRLEETQDTEDKEAKVSEVESKPEEISETKPIESVEEKPAEVDVPVQVSVFEKLGAAEELPAKEMETIKDKEPGEIPQTEKSKELEDSEVASVEEKPDESIKIGNAQELSSPEIDKTERGQAITEKEIELPENEFKHEEISETEPGEKQDESKLEFVEENLDVPTKLVELVEEKVGGKEESPAKEVDAAAENEVKVSEINETKPVETIEGQSVDPEIPEKPSVEAVEEKPENVDESHCKVVEDPVEEKLVEQSQVTEQHGKEPPAAEPSENEAKVYEAELKPDVESTPEAKLEEKSKVTELHDKELPCAEPLGKETKGLEDDLRPEEISKSTPEEKLIKQFEATEHEKETPENEAVALQTEIKPEETVESTPDAKPLEQSKVTELHDKELPSAEPSEKEWKVLEDTLKPEEISESTPEEKLIEQSEDTEQSEKEPKVFEAELKPDEISESTPHKVVKQSEVIEQSEKEPPNSEPVEQGKIEALAEKVNETELLNKDEPTILETRVEELPEKADTPNDHEESVKKIVDFNHPPEEKFIDSGRKEPETETQDEKSVATRELNPREDPKPTESEAIEKPTKEEVTSRDIEPLTENGSTKNEAEVEGNGHEEATKEAEKCEPATQIENIGRSLKEKLEQEKRDDKPTKTDVQTETTNESEDTKAAEDESKEEVPVKTTQKQSNNIMKLVKQSLVKAKKAIIGKSTNSKAPVSEIKCDEASK